MSTPSKKQHAWLEQRALQSPAARRRAKSPSPVQPSGPRLLGKAEVLRLANTSYPTIWTWMREGKFPRSRIVGGRSMWLSTEIEQWLAALPLRHLKGDDTPPEAA